MSESEIQRRLRHVRLGVYLLTALAVLGILAAAWWEHADIHSTLKCRCLPVRSNVNDRMREGAGSFGNFSKPNIAQRDSV